MPAGFPENELIAAGIVVHVALELELEPGCRDPELEPEPGSIEPEMEPDDPGSIPMGHDLFFGLILNGFGALVLSLTLK